MRKKILFIVHGERSDPGRVGRTVRRLGYDYETRQPSGGEALPTTMDGYAGAVVFGGPMSANDDKKLDFIRTELDWIPMALESGKPFLGICLGAQMLARVLGGKVRPHPKGMVEVGYYPVRQTTEGTHLFDEETHFYQWHGETFEVPRSATLLAEGEIFSNQAFAWKNAHGIQFHPEVTTSMIHYWTSVASDRLKSPGAQSRALQLKHDFRHRRAVRTWLRDYLSYWISR